MLALGLLLVDGNRLVIQLGSPVEFTISSIRY